MIYPYGCPLLGMELLCLFVLRAKTTPVRVTYRENISQVSGNSHVNTWKRTHPEFFSIAWRTIQTYIELLVFRVVEYSQSRHARKTRSCQL